MATTTSKKYEMLASEFHLSRLYSNVNTLDSQSCWNWTGAKVKDGYGVVARKIKGKKYNIFVHRLSYYSQFGEIPNGMVIDHTCHTAEIDSCKDVCQHRSCVNPSHLRVVSIKENVKTQRTHSSYWNSETFGQCRNGHKWEEGSFKVYKSGKRSCNTCRKEYNKSKAGK